MEKLNNDLQQTILRFSEKLTIGDGCFEWVTPGDGKHYPKFSWNGKKIDAHRVSYMLFNGDIPPGMMVCHKCDNRRCVNSNHLFLGTRSDNMKDCYRKQRMQVPRPPQTKLNEIQVAQIKAELGKGRTQQSIALEFGISKWAVQDIAANKVWKNVA